MDLKLLKQFAKQDLQASRSAVQAAEQKIDSISRAVEGAGGSVESIPRVKELRDLIKQPFQMRLDYKDWDSNRISVVYLAKSREGITTDSIKIAPWSSPWAKIRHLEVGDDDDLKVGGRDLSITLQMKGQYEQSAPDVKNAVYILAKDTLVLDSAAALLGEPAERQQSAPLTKKFGLRELVLQIDLEQDTTMRFPMKGFLRIEGVPGSGKTTVALQRIAYLIDRQYHELSLRQDSEPIFAEEKTLVLVLNEVLELYLKRLMDDLNLTSVRTASFNDFLRNELLAPTGRLSTVNIVPSTESSAWLELIKTRHEILNPLKLFTRLWMEKRVTDNRPILLKDFEKEVPPRYRKICFRVSESLSAFEKRIESGSLSLKDLLTDLAQIEQTVPKSGKTRNAWELMNKTLATRLRDIWNPFDILSGFGIIHLTKVPLFGNLLSERGRTMKDLSLTFAQATELNEEQAREYFESILWPGGPVCPHCGSQKSWDIKSASARPGVYECADCGKQFTVTVGTVMHGSHIAIRQWLVAFCLMTSSKKGVSALQLQRNLGLGSYKSAWHLAHRIRYAMTEGTLCPPLKGTIEVDETYVGGKSREGVPGRGSERKVPVVALVERNGRVHSAPIERVNAKTLKGAIRANVHKDSCIMTDEWPAYKGIGKEFNGGHQVVNHSKKEYVRGNAYTNTVESYFALLKRGVHGIYHHISKVHLHRYCDEFNFRWNLRKVNDGERAIGAIQGIVGKRLSYKPSVASVVLN